MSRTLWRRGGIVILMAGVFAGGMWYGAYREQARQPWGRERLLSTALDSVRVNFLDSLPEGELMRRAVSGMLRELHDPYAALLERDGMNVYRGTLRGESQGLGLVLRLRGPSVVVRRVLTGSPAADAGLHAGDVVLAVDGRRASEAWSTPRPDAGVQDSAGRLADTVRLQVVRFTNNDTTDVAIVRSSWRMPAVTEALLAAEGVGYARLASSVTGSAEELERAVEGLVERGAKSLVLDLRGNPGGLYDEGVLAASLFLSRGDVVASLDRRGTTEPQVQTVRRTRWPTLPLAVLVDANTASSAELIAAALRDHGRALLIGDHTYGKGVVQRVVHINPELSLRLTTARWLPPSKTPLTRREEKSGRVTGGLTPDLLITPAGRIDPSAVPGTLSPTRARALSDAVDGAVARAVLDGWSGAPLPLLERRLRGLLVQAAPGIDADPLHQITMVGDGTRVAVRRLLEMTRGDEALWPYAADDDPVLRAGLDVLAPDRSPATESDSVAVDTTAFPAALAGDSVLVTRLQTWITRRFRAAHAVPYDESPAGPAAIAGSAARIDGRLRAAARDTVVAVHFSGSPFRPAHAAGRTVLLADPSGVATPLEAEVIARLPFRAPLTPASDSNRSTGWRHGWAYLVVFPERTGPAHTGSFMGWRIVTMPEVPLADGRPRTGTATRGASQESGARF